MPALFTSSCKTCHLHAHDKPHRFCRRPSTCLRVRGMEKYKTSNRYSPEMRAPAVRMVLEHRCSYQTQSAAVSAIAPKIGCILRTLRAWVRQAERDCPSTTRRHAAPQNPKDLGRQLAGLRGSQSLAAVVPRRRGFCALHHRASDGRDGFARCYSGKGRKNNDTRYFDAMPA